MRGRRLVIRSATSILPAKPAPAWRRADGKPDWWRRSSLGGNNAGDLPRSTVADWRASETRRDAVHGVENGGANRQKKEFAGSGAQSRDHLGGFGVHMHRRTSGSSSPARTTLIHSAAGPDVRASSTKSNCGLSRSTRREISIADVEGSARKAQGAFNSWMAPEIPPIARGSGIRDAPGPYVCCGALRCCGIERHLRANDPLVPLQECFD